MTFLRLAICLAALGAAAPAAMAKDTVIHAGRLIDGVSKQPRDKVSILIKDERIVAVQPGFVTPAGAEIIDLSQVTVLPGLIDCHVHVSSLWDGVNQTVALVTRTPADIALRSTPNVKRLLDAGFTSVRNVGSRSNVDIALKRAIDAGIIPGPRIWASGDLLGPTGGHSDPGNGLVPELQHLPGSESLIDTPEAARRIVREQRRAGADLIKIVVSGGVTTKGDDPDRQLMTDDEIKAVVETAHALGMKVAAHAHGKKPIEQAIRAGVDSIEHGSLADADSYKLFKERGTYLVSTQLVGVAGLEYIDAHPGYFGPDEEAKARAMTPVMLRNLSAAYKAGVKIAFGTDMLSPPRGTNAREFALMVQAGMTPMDAIVAATGSAADLLGAADKVGSVQPGRFADLIAVAGDPLQDITELERVKFIMKNGAVYKQ